MAFMLATAAAKQPKRTCQELCFGCVEFLVQPRRAENLNAHTRHSENSPLSMAQSVGSDKLHV